MLPWKSVAMTLQEGRKPEGQRVVPGQMENTKGKKIWVDILISQEVERREIHYCFSSAVTMCKTKTQLRPVGQISRGKCCLLPRCFPQKTNGEDLTVTVLLVSLIRKSTSLQSSDFVKQSETLNLQGATVSSLAAWGSECFSLLTDSKPNSVTMWITK